MVHQWGRKSLDIATLVKNSLTKIYMKKAILVFLWFICLMVVWTLVGSFLSAPNTFLVFLGIVIAVLYIVVSVKTKCFTHKWGK